MSKKLVDANNYEEVIIMKEKRRHLREIYNQELEDEYFENKKIKNRNRNLKHNKFQSKLDY